MKLAEVTINPIREKERDPLARARLSEIEGGVSMRRRLPTADDQANRRRTPKEARTRRGALAELVFE